MTQLLVSVRSAVEAQAAFAGGADIIDVKEPRNGSLGAATPAVLAEVRDSIGDRVPLSTALGELNDGVHFASAELVGFTFAKVGLSACQPCDWNRAWRDWAARLPRSVAPVVVAYADHAVANAPPVSEVLASAIEWRASILLIDTFDKSGGDLFAHLSLPRLRELCQFAHDAGVQVALAGSLSFDTIDTALQASPDIIAVRGAVCADGRNGVVMCELVKRMAKRLSIPRQRTATMSRHKLIDSRREQF